jgi:hypothetical protein
MRPVRSGCLPLSLHVSPLVPLQMTLPPPLPMAMSMGSLGTLMPGSKEPMARFSTPRRSRSLNFRSLLASKNRLVTAAPVKGSMALM